MRRTRREIQIQIRMRLEWLRRILIRLLIDSQVTRRAAVHSLNRLEGLIIIKVAQNYLIDALRRIHEIEDWSVAERHDDGAGVESVQSRLQPGVIRQQALALFGKRFA